jgi:hypothetical protein
MTDPPIFSFPVMPFLLVLTCAMVFFSSRTTQSNKPSRSAHACDQAEHVHAQATQTIHISQAG